MAHWKSLMDRTYLGWFDLPQGRDTVVTIDHIEGGELNNGGKKSHKPICFFRGKQKGLALNATNCKTLEALFGWDYDRWAGKQVALYIGTTTDPSNHGTQVNCVRIRNKKVSRQRDDKAPLIEGQNESAPDLSEDPREVEADTMQGSDES
jgi:hypothetical protein